jgi:two-component system, LytTR family, sensor kinase
VHLLLAPIYAVLNFLYLYYMIRWFGGEASAETLKRGAGWLLYFNFLIYLLQFALYHGYEILRQLRTKEKIALELLTLKTKQELATLKAQINPHFLFNTLNSISAMASTDAEETRTMIAQLADLLRYATESSKQDFVPLKDELQFVQDYIALESKRLGDRLTTNFQIDQSLVSFSVPPMILQPLVENAIKHGIAPAEEGGSVCVQIQKETEGITFRISNTGIGLSYSDPLATTDGVGLKNTDARIRKIYGDSARLKIQSLDNRGCEVAFTLPLK